MSRVDVVIPCYNYGHFLRDCVASVLGQAGVDVRVLIIDDCSKDDTPNVGAALAAEDSRVEFRRHAVNRGHIATYNEGLLEWASAEYSLLLSADDLLIPGALARATALMDAHPEVGMTYGREIKTPHPEREKPPVTEKYEARVMTGDQFWEASCRVASNIVPTPSAVVRTSLQKAIGGYRADLPHSGDMEMWLRFACHGSIGVVEAYQAFYRSHGQNMSVAYPGVRDLNQRKVAFDSLFRDYGSRLPDLGNLKTLASRGLASDAFWTATQSFERGDMEQFRQCLDFAVLMDPEIRNSRSWSRLRYKQLMGRRLWGIVGAVLGRVRRAMKPPTRGGRLSPAVA